MCIESRSSMEKRMEQGEEKRRKFLDSQEYLLLIGYIKIPTRPL
jgi:hypothetical protein